MNQVNIVINGMLSADNPSDYWKDTNNEFAELKASHTVIQRDKKSVWEHTMTVLDMLRIKNRITLLSGLFHDLGKYEYEIVSLDNQKISKFPGHVNKSVRIAKTKLVEWGANEYLIDRVCRLISMHMYDLVGSFKEQTIRKFIADVGHDNIENWFILREADSASYGVVEQYYDRFLAPFKLIISGYLQKQPGDDRYQFDNAGNIQIEGIDN